MLISFETLSKLFMTLVGIAGLAMFILWPINDQPTSKTQFVFFFIMSILFLLIMYAPISVHVDWTIHATAS